MVTDQGLVQGKAHETLRYRRSLGAEVAILADVLVKHAQPLAPAPVETLARDTFLRGGADALIVTGFATGEPADLGRAARVRDAVDAPVLLGSGVTSLNLAEARRVADGAIVGTWLKLRGEITNPVDPERARALVERRDALAAATEGAG
jgi:membrane complex biogenesis BtpA family protein